MVAAFTSRLAAAAALAITMAGGAGAATLDGAHFRLDYLFPDAGTVYPFTDGPIFGTVGPGTDAILIVEGVTAISLDFGPASLEVFLNTVLTDPTWNNALFNGLRVTFLDLPAAIDAFELVDTVLAPITPTFTQTELFINWAGMAYVDGSTASFSVGLAPVPLPAALPLLLAGLGAIGVAGRLRGRRAGA